MTRTILLATEMLQIDYSKIGFTLIVSGFCALGIFIAYSGFGLWSRSQRFRDSKDAKATITKRFSAGEGLALAEYAVVSFVDGAGNQHTTTIGVPSKGSFSLREGGTMWISYEASDPQKAQYGGEGLQLIYSLAGMAMMIFGPVMALFSAWLLVAGLSGWYEKPRSDDSHPGKLHSRPPLTKNTAEL